ncbi:MAG TPA: hypothetical protein VMT34_00765, partial [Aggregatilineales bacterium]|nr:hypothetical protein [Aggregatilineales bacterium]
LPAHDFQHRLQFELCTELPLFAGHWLPPQAAFISLLSPVSKISPALQTALSRVSPPDFNPAKFWQIAQAYKVDSLSE